MAIVRGHMRRTKRGATSVRQHKRRQSFKVGDRVRGTASLFQDKVGIVAMVEWNGDAFVYTLDGVKPIIWECNLELAPKEEWVDVAKECSVRLVHSVTFDSWIELEHGTRILATFGDRVAINKDSAYKIQFNNNEPIVNSFRVFHKQEVAK